MKQLLFVKYCLRFENNIIRTQHFNDYKKKNLLINDVTVVVTAMS